MMNHPAKDSTLNPTASPRFTHRLNGLLTVVLGLLAIAYVWLAVVGARQSYTPVPLTDMWDGTVDFYRRVSAGDAGIWLAGHNEHRIVLARVLFWLDMRLFGGSAVFLIVANYLLVATSALVMWRFLRATMPRHEDAMLRAGTFLFLLAWLFSWCQEGNLTWGFQSQFILAQLLPLAALLALYHASVSTSSSRRWFLLSVLLGVASLGTMANGVLTLPILAAYAAITRQGWRRFLVLVGLALIMGAAYQRGLATGDGPSKLELLRQQPYQYVRFLLLYLGSPFYYIARNVTPHAREVAAAMGALLVIGSALAALVHLRRPQGRHAQWALVMFLVFIGGTAAGTTLGRAASGEIHALASRYTTPAVMAWAALAIWVVSFVALRGRRWHAAVLVLMAGALGVGMIEQKHALDDQADKHYEQSLAAVAMGLGIADDAQVQIIFPFTENALRLARDAAAANLSIFTAAPWQATPTVIGSSAPALPGVVCRGNIDESREAPSQQDYVRIRGWLDGPAPDTEGGALRVVRDGKVVGYGLIGHSRPDVAEVTGAAAAARAGFVAYVPRDQLGHPLVLLGAGCQLPAVAPVMAYRETVEVPAPGTKIITEAAVTPGHPWLGKDFHVSSYPGMKIMASLVRGDSDKGTLRFTAHPGDAFYYRSGPTVGRQVIQLDDGRLGSAKLPLAEQEWVRLSLDAPSLPETFTVTLVDDGDGWGEWSAIAVVAAAPAN
jgi:hypothetical protein